MAAIQALQQWCKQKCEGYKDVNITNMTTSFRDGLAFCAILHCHRPDLIDFNSLSKENIYENNHLAFKVAETELGIPALLDAEDMVALKVPDRLSILTYVSQYYNYFHGRSPIGGMAGIKRSPSNSGEEPVGKKVVSKPVTPAPAKPSPFRVPSEPKTNAAVKGKENAPVEAKRRILAENTNPRNSSCTVCGDHVHLVQRLLIDGKLYHRSCFRCKLCSTSLKPGNYKAGNAPGAFVCNQHEQPTHLQNSLPIDTKSVAAEKKPEYLPSGLGSSKFESKKPEQESRKPQSNDAAKAPVHEASSLGGRKSGSVAANPSSHFSDLNVGSKSGRCENLVASPFSSHWTPSSAKTQRARETFFQASDLPADKTEPIKSQGSPLNPSLVTRRTSFPGPGSNAGSSEKEQARNILKHVLPAPGPSTNRPASLSTTTGKPPPSPSGLQRLEPKSTPTSKISKPVGVLSAMEKPQRDPLGIPPVVDSSTKDPGNRAGIGTATQNRFNGWTNGQNADTRHKGDSKVTKTGGVSVTEEKSETPADWRSRLKPVAKKLASQGDAKNVHKPAEVHKTATSVALRPTQDDRKPVTSPAIQETVPSANPPVKKKLLVPHPDVSSGWQRAKQDWEDPSETRRLEVPSSPKRTVVPVRPSSPRTSWKAPSMQAVSPPKLHPDYIPEEEIQREVRQIERGLDRLEHKGVDLEKQLRKSEGDDTEDALMVEWFKLIHEKQLLLRRESELMHKINQQKLEEEQWDIESELRTLMSKSDTLKTPKEKSREEELLQLYVETVNNRNKIVEDLDEDRLREREEDEMLVAMIQQFDGPRNTSESEKKKSDKKFGLFRIPKTKN